MFAPLWTDADFQAGEVTYHIYDRTSSDLKGMEKFRVKHILKLAKEDTVNYGGSSAIDPSWVMVITWVNSTPRMFYDPTIEEVCHLHRFCWQYLCKVLSTMLILIIR